MKHTNTLHNKALLLLLASLLMSACHTARHTQQSSTTPYVTPVAPINNPTATVVMPQGLTMGRRHASLNTAPLCAPQSWQANLQQSLDSLLTASTLLDSTQLALCVYDLTDDRPLYAVNASQRMRPASCMKLLTAITALDILGANYTYQPTVLKPGWGWCWDDEECGIREFEQKGARLRHDMLYQEPRRWTLAEALQPIMKKSHNMMAEGLFWQLSEKKAYGTRRECAEQVSALIQRAGMDATPFTIADGSGLSLYDYVSARLFVNVLRYAHKHSNIFNVLYPSLPVAGVDGTLSKRMKGTPAAGNVHAKTGTVTAVSSLSGYCTAANGHLLCFSIINAGVVRTANGREFQDSVCTLLCR